MAVNQLHIHIMEKLQGIRELLAYESDEKLAMADELAEAVVSSVTIDSLVIGTLEEVFFEMVNHPTITDKTYGDNLFSDI